MVRRSHIPLTLITLFSFLISACGNLNLELPKMPDILPSINPQVVITYPTATSFLGASGINSVNVTGTCTENGRNVVLTGAISASTVCTNNAFSVNVDFSALVDGNLALNANHASPSGVAATQHTVNFVKDVQAPNAVVFSDPANNITLGATNYDFTWTATDNGPAGLHATNTYTIRTFANGTCAGAAATTTVDSNSSKSYTSLTDGNVYSISVTVTDKAGNATGPTCSPSVTVNMAVPTLALADATTALTSYVRQVATSVTIGNDASAVKWCLSETQTTAPANGSAACSGTGWLVVKPTSFNVTAGDGLKTVYLWIADVGDVVVPVAVTDSITLDTTLPATPLAKLTDPNSTSNFYTNQGTVNLAITGDTGATAWCVLEQIGSAAVPAAPTWNSCSTTWVTTRPTTLNLGATGTRKVYVFTRDVAMNVSLSQPREIDAGWMSLTSLGGYWKLNETNANNGFTILDTSGNNYNGVLGTNEAAGVFKNTSGQLSGGLTFDGTDDEVRMGDVLDMPTNDFTIAFWMKTASAAQGLIVGKGFDAGGGSPKYNVLMSSTPGMLWGYVGDGTTTLQTYGPVPNPPSVPELHDGLWHQVTVVFKRAPIHRVNHFIDGVDMATNVDTSTVGDLDNIYDFMLGQMHAGPGYSYQGDLDDVSVWGRALSYEEIRKIYLREKVSGSADYIEYSNSAPANPTLALSDGTTSSTSYVRQVATAVAIGNDASAVKWCLSETQTTAPATGSAACSGTGWVTTEPTSFNVSGGDGLKTVYVWIADVYNNVNGSAVSDQITLDTVKPATPLVVLSDTSSSSQFATDIASTTLTITGDTDANRWCVIEQIATNADPATPVFSDACFITPKPTTVNLGATGTRKVFVFTRDAALNVSSASPREIDSGWISTTGLAGYWRINDTPISNGSSVTDQTTTNNLVLTTNNNTNDKSTTGKITNGVLLDGAGDYIEKTSATGLPNANASQTISIWFKTTNYIATHLVNLTNSSTSGVFLQFNNGAQKIQAAKWGSSVLVDSGVLTIDDGNWHHAAYTYDGTTHRIFFDGVEKNSGTGAADSGVASLVQLGVETSGPSYFDGTLDEASVWSRALSPYEIHKIFQKQNYSGSSDVILYDSSAPAVTDVTSTTANGTYGIGATVNVRVTFDDIVTITNTPRLQLETGATDQYANYVSGSGTNIIDFTYTVQSGDVSSDLNYVGTTSLELNGGTIRDVAGNNATLTLPALGGASLGTNKNIVIDGIAPVPYLWVQAPTNAELSSNSDAWLSSTNLLGLWHMNDAAGALVDSGPNSLNCAVSGTPVYSTTGKIAGAINFDTTDDYCTAAHHASLTGMSALTVSAWVYLNQLPSQAGHHFNVMVKRHPVAPDSSFYLYLNSTTNSAVFGVVNNALVDVNSSSTAVTAKRWLHIVGVYQSGQPIKVFVNNAENYNYQNSQTGTVYASTGALLLSNDSASLALEGRIDEVAVWGRNLSGSEVQALYEKQLGKYQVASPIVLRTEFSENVSGFANGDITVTGGGLAANTAGGAANYTSDVAPGGQGAFDVSVGAGGAQDTATNTNVVSNTLNFNYDSVAPTLASSLQLINPATSPGTVTTPTIRVNGVNIGDIVKIYTASNCLSPAYRGSGTSAGTSIDIASSTLSDGSYTFYAEVVDVNGNSNGCSTQSVAYAVDATPPQVTVEQKVGQADPAGGTPVSFTVTFTENVTGLLAADFTVGGTATTGCLSLSGSGSAYQFDVGCVTANGTIIVSLPANAAQDGLGNNSQASTSTDNTVTFTAITNFTIAGVQGGSDTTSDNKLNGDTNHPVVHWSNPSNESTFDVTIYESDGTTVKCNVTALAANTTSYNFSACNLTDNTAYKAGLVAKDSGGGAKAATNSLYDFTYLAAVNLSGSLNSGVFVNTKLSTGKIVSDPQYLYAQFPDNRSSTGWFDMSNNVGLYHFQNYLTSATDSSGRGNNGTPNNADPTRSTAKFGHGVWFNGQGGTYISLGDGADMRMGMGDFSVSMWINFNRYSSTDNPNCSRLFEKNSYPTSWMALDICNNGKMVLQLADHLSNNVDLETPTQTIGPIDVWHHVAFTVNRTTNLASIYLNGTKVSSVSEDISTVTGNLDVVGSPFTLTGAWAEMQGNMDEVAIFKQALSPADVLSIYNTQKVVVENNFALNSSWIDTTGLVAYWKLDELNGIDGSTFVDSSGNSNTGTLDTGTDWSTNKKSNKGKLSGGVSLDGDDGVTIANSASINTISAEITVAAWVKNSSLDANSRNTILGRYDSSAQAAFWLGVNNTSNKEIVFYGNGGACSLTGSKMNYNSFWNHLVFTSNANESKLYVDGILSATGPSCGTFPSIATKTCIGASNASSDSCSYEFFQGELDDVSLWSRALDSTEISNLFRRQSPDYAGTYVSQVFDASATTTWTELNPVPVAPYLKEMPASTEAAYTSDNVTLSNLITYLKMNGTEETFVGTAAGSLTDSSGQNNPATPVNPNASQRRFQIGRFNQAIDFDGVDDGIEVPDAATLDTTQITIAAWILNRETDLSSGYSIATRQSGTSFNDVFWFGFNGSNSYFFYDGVNTIMSSNIVWFDTFKWAHIAATTDGSTLRLYRNGVQVASGAAGGNLISETSPICLGSGANDATRACNSEFFKGMMDEVMIFNTALSAAQIQALYNRGGNRLHYQIRSCNDNACSGETFSGMTGLLTNYFSELYNSLAALPIFSGFTQPNNRYIQYRVVFEADEPTVSVPELSDVVIKGTR